MGQRKVQYTHIYTYIHTIMATSEREGGFGGRLMMMMVMMAAGTPRHGGVATYRDIELASSQGTMGESHAYESDGTPQRSKLRDAQERSPWGSLPSPT